MKAADKEYDSWIPLEWLDGIGRKGCEVICIVCCVSDRKKKKIWVIHIYGRLVRISRVRGGHLTLPMIHYWFRDRERCGAWVMQGRERVPVIRHFREKIIAFCNKGLRESGPRRAAVESIMIFKRKKEFITSDFLIRQSTSVMKWSKPKKREKKYQDDWCQWLRTVSTLVRGRWMVYACIGTDLRVFHHF